MLMMAILAQSDVQVPVADDSAGWILSSVKWAMEQYQQKNYLPLMSFVIMVIVWSVGHILEDKVDKKFVPLISSIIGVVVSIATSLTALALDAKPVDIVSTIVSGLAVGAMANGFWSQLGKFVLPKRKKSPKKPSHK